MPHLSEPKQADAQRRILASAALDAANAKGPFSYPPFRSMWIANLVSNFGGLIHTVGAAWLMASITSSPTMVALVQSSISLPIVLLSLVAGALADSVDRRRMMIGAQSFMLVMSVALAWFAWAQWLSPWLLLAFTFLIGCGTATNTPAWQASVGDVVPRQQLSTAVSLNSMGFNLARSVGPAIGGAIVATAGAAAAFAVNALSYIGLIAVLARWHPKRADPGIPRESLGSAIITGLRYVRMSPPVLSVLGRGAIFGAAASSLTALLPIVARDVLARGAFTYGALLGAFGVGAVLGALAAARLRRGWATESVIRLALLLWIAGAIIVAVSRVVPLTLAALSLSGAGFLIALSTFNVTVQLATPRWVVARALSLYQMVTFGSMALGSAFWGAVASMADLPAALFGAAALQAGCLLLGMKLKMPDPGDQDLDVMREWREPDTLLPVSERTGPVEVTIEYLIKEAQQPEFLAVMSSRRRTRLRDGARSWALLRDASAPDLWIERYRTETWLEYVRYNSRVTKVDAELAVRLRELHCGNNPPLVRRLIEHRARSRTGVDVFELGDAALGAGT